MTTKAQTALASSAGLLWKVIESYGLDPEPFFRKARIDPRLMNDPQARFSLLAIDTIYSELYETINDPCMGLKLANLWHPSHLSSLGYAWLASSTLSTALSRLSRYVRIINDAITVQLEENKEHLIVTISSDSREIPAHFHADAASAIILSMCRVNYGEELNPVSVSFSHSVTDCSGEYFSFFRCPVEFGAEQNRIVFTSEVVSKRLNSSNPQLAQINDQVMISYLARLDKDDIIQQVKVAIIDQLPSGNVTDDSVSEAVYTSKRSLQRKLHEKGTTFKAILTEVREDLALKYIYDRTLTLTEISFMLGFSEMSSFSRAFKRWTGESPKEFRKLD
ncbi:MAG: AraC family transcriptional regulator [Gammaproteobacteria bacterium]|nr:MAG: AraC family transcriptional regulator [Gammaproteobacteria bacterium]